MSEHLPPVDHGQTEQKPKWEVSSLVGLTIIGAATAIMFAIFFSANINDGHRVREKANQIKCASNLRQIGQAIQLYATDNQGLFPPDAQTIAMAQSISLDCFVCPSTPDTPAKSPGELPAHHSCIYVGADLSARSKPDCIVVLEDPANHNLEGSNVLFADGHAEFCDLPTVQLFLNELNAGHNPPATLTPTLSKAGAEQDYQKNWKARMPQLKTGVWRIPIAQPAAPR